MPYQSPSHGINRISVSFASSMEPNNDRSEGVSTAFLHNASGTRINTDVYMYNAIKAAHPDVDIIDTNVYNVDILAYVSNAEDGSIEVLSESDMNSGLSSSHIEAVKDHAFASSISHVGYIPPSRRLDGGSGTLAVTPIFGTFLVRWHEHEFFIYLVDGRDGSYPTSNKRQYILTTDKASAFTLIKTVGLYQNILHDEIWVYDQGYWQKDAAFYRAVQKSRWEDIILPDELKGDLLKTIQRFYDSPETYRKLHVPWKRGLIFYGPPGNGKTVTIKATMKTLYDRKEPVPTLYVKSLSSFGGREYSISEIFSKARQQAPCYLVFEDLDSLVTDSVRSFFLNAVDGLSENEGILMIGSTNHLDRLDPGITKRPSRFDRKYLFPDPSLELRTQYCIYWQGKLKDNPYVAFPDELLTPIAVATKGFSFAYLQEAFVSTLLKLANDRETSDGKANKQIDIDLSELEDEIIFVERAAASISVIDDALEAFQDKDNDPLDKYLLWREIKIQIAILRKDLNQSK